MTATWVALITRSRIISNRQYIPCSLYQTCLVRDTVYSNGVWVHSQMIRRPAQLCTESSTDNNGSSCYKTVLEDPPSDDSDDNDDSPSYAGA